MPVTKLLRGVRVLLNFVGIASGAFKNESSLPVQHLSLPVGTYTELSKPSDRNIWSSLEVSEFGSSWRGAGRQSGMKKAQWGGGNGADKKQYA